MLEILKYDITLKGSLSKRGSGGSHEHVIMNNEALPGSVTNTYGTLFWAVFVAPQWVILTGKLCQRKINRAWDTDNEHLSKN